MADEAERSTSAQDEPWRMRADWAAGRSRGSVAEAGNGFAVLGVLFWIAFGVGIIWLLFFSQVRDARDVPIFGKGVFGLGFAFMGFMISLVTIAKARRSLRYGRSWLTFDSVQVSPGGVLSGRIDCRVDPQLEPTFQLTLTCIESYLTGTADHRVQHADRIWHAQYECLGERSTEVANGSLVPISFTIPGDAPPCGVGARGTIAWLLKARSAQVGVDYQESFAIPVFAGPASAPAVERVPRAAPPPEQRPAHGKLRYALDGDALVVTFPPSMNPTLALLPLGALIMTGYMTCAYALQGTWWWSPIPGVLAALALVGTARAWLMRTTLTVRRGEIVVERSLLGFSSRTAYAGPDLAIATSMDFQIGTLYMSKLKVGRAYRKKAVGSLIGDDAELDYLTKAIEARLRG